MAGECPSILIREHIIIFPKQYPITEDLSGVRDIKPGRPFFWPSDIDESLEFTATRVHASK